MWGGTATHRDVLDGSPFVCLTKRYGKRGSCSESSLTTPTDVTLRHSLIEEDLSARVEARVSDTPGQVSRDLGNSILLGTMGNYYS